MYLHIYGINADSEYISYMLLGDDIKIHIQIMLHGYEHGNTNMRHINTNIQYGNTGI